MAWRKPPVYSDVAGNKFGFTCIYSKGEDFAIICIIFK